MQVDILIPASGLLLIGFVIVPLLIAEFGLMAVDRFRSGKIRRRNRRVCPGGRYYM